MWALKGGRRSQGCTVRRHHHFSDMLLILNVPVTLQAQSHTLIWLAPILYFSLRYKESVDSNNKPGLAFFRIRWRWPLSQTKWLYAQSPPFSTLSLIQRTFCNTTISHKNKKETWPGTQYIYRCIEGLKREGSGLLLDKNGCWIRVTRLFSVDRIPHRVSWTAFDTSL